MTVEQFNKKIHKINDIPNELKQFVKKDTYSLLIKGGTGTGKTTLSLTILRSLNDNNNFFFISTRNSPKQILNYYPWLVKFVKHNNDKNFSKENISDLHFFEDARLDEPEPLFERITNQLMDVKTPIIIVDSWDSVASLMDNEARINNERVLQTWRERAGAKLIFTTEGTHESSLEYLVDGVVELNSSLIDNIRLRQLNLVKLRGIPIKKPSYIFSLRDRILRCYDRYYPHEYDLSIDKSKQLIGNIKQKSINYVKIGFKDLDYSFGSSLQNGILVLEKDQILSNNVLSFFTKKIISNLLSYGYSIILDSSIDEKLNLKVDLLGNRSKLNGTFSVDIINNGTYKNWTNDEVEKIVQKNEANMNVHIISSSSADEIFKNNKDLFRKFMKEFSLSIIIQNSLDFDFQKYAEVADIHLKFVLLSGSLFLKSIIPSSNLFGIRRKSDDGIELEYIL